MLKFKNSLENQTLVLSLVQQSSSNITQMYTTTTTKKPETFTPALFNSLIESKVLQTGNDLEDIGFKCELGTAAISFFGNIENNYQVEIEDFGKMRGSKWVQFTPTESQVTRMQNIILSQVEAIEESKVKEEAVEAEPYYPKYNWA